MRLLALVALTALMAACAPVTQVILLPQPARTSAVEVSTRAADVVLSTPYAEAQIQASGAVTTDHANAAQLQSRYGQLLSVQPPPPQHFTLYFETGGVELTPASQQVLSALLAVAEKRPGAALIITGHTDRVGTGPSNDALSLERARAIREMVIQRGFDPRRIEAVGRGEREPAVPTADEVAEPRNRRTEITVR